MHATSTRNVQRDATDRRTKPNGDVTKGEDTQIHVVGRLERTITGIPVSSRHAMSFLSARPLVLLAVGLLALLSTSAHATEYSLRDGNVVDAMYSTKLDSVHSSSADFTLHFDPPATTTSPPSAPFKLTVAQTRACEARVSRAQQAFASENYDAADAELTECVVALERLAAGRSDGPATAASVADAWLRAPLSSWPSLFFYRALSRWKKGSSHLVGARSDVDRAVAMAPRSPDHWSLRAAVCSAADDAECAFRSSLHELALHLDLPTAGIDQVCSTRDASSGVYSCHFQALIEWAERRLDWHIADQEPRDRMKLWTTHRVENVFPVAKLQKIVRCLRSLVYTRESLSHSSPLRSRSFARVAHLLSMFLPADADLHNAAATALFGAGDMRRALSHGMHDLTIRLASDWEETEDEEIVPLHEAWTTMLRHGALLLGAGLETHLTNMARRLLEDAPASRDALQDIADTCDVALCGAAPASMPVGTRNAHPFYAANCTREVSYAALRHALVSCLRHQRLLHTLFAEQADSHRSSLAITNDFGYGPLHHFALLGDEGLLHELLGLDPTANANTMTYMGLSALHLASTRGNVEATRALLTLGVRTTWLDWSQRTALDVACVHGFPWNLRVAHLLQTGLSAADMSAHCAAVRASKAPLDFADKEVPHATCLQRGGWAPYLVYDRTVLPHPYPCLAPISLTPRLTFVSAEEERQHVRAQRRVRDAKGAADAEDPVELTTLPRETSPLAALYNTKCDIPILKPPTSYSSFIVDIVSLQRPVLIRGAVRYDLLEFTETYHALQRDRLLETYGHVRLPAARIPYARSFGFDAEEVTVADFIAYMDRMSASDARLKTVEGAADWHDAASFRNRSYVFVSVPLPDPDAGPAPPTANVTDASALLPLFFTPLWMHPPADVPEPRDDGQLDPTTHVGLSLRKLQFFLGPRFSGAPSHFHRSAVNLQWFGRKRWTLSPPPQAKYAKSAVLDEHSTAADFTQGDAPLTCIQEAGDALFVPDFWSHETINLEESIGFAAELLWGATHFSI